MKVSNFISVAELIIQLIAAEIAQMDLLSLPYELRMQILSQPQIEMKDLFNVMLSCRQLFATVEESNELWRQQFHKK